MDSLIEIFHIDIKLLLAQVINFAIVFGVIYYFALKPLTKVMADRTKTIEKSLENAKAVEVKLRETKSDYERVISEAKKEANAILEKANALAEEQKKATITKAKEEIGAVINKEKAQMQVEKASVLKEIKKEVADMVALSLEKVLADQMDAKKEKEIIKKTIK